jgi:hypothetical protein
MELYFFSSALQKAVCHSIHTQQPKLKQHLRAMDIQKQSHQLITMAKIQSTQRRSIHK